MHSLKMPSGVQVDNKETMAKGVKEGMDKEIKEVLVTTGRVDSRVAVTARMDKEAMARGVKERKEATLRNKEDQADRVVIRGAMARVGKEAPVRALKEGKEVMDKEPKEEVTVRAGKIIPGGMVRKGKAVKGAMDNRADQAVTFREGKGDKMVTDKVSKADLTHLLQDLIFFTHLHLNYVEGHPFPSVCGFRDSYGAKYSRLTSTMCLEEQQVTLNI